MSKFAKILRDLRKEQGLTQKGLADEVGISKSAISMYELGNREPDFKTEEALALYFSVSIDYLRFGPQYQSEAASVPLLGVIACGEPILAEPNIEEYVHSAEGVRADFALRCRGDSMINARIFDGDIVYLRAQPDVADGQIAAVVIEDEATLKRVRKFPGKLVLQPENPMYESLVFEREALSDVRIIGLAIAFLSVVR
ncbi:MAG TPA: S24 family peptidase [Terriglobales bacterium]|nr:S24 family peptidase [Terriglobales bacterium]